MTSWQRCRLGWNIKHRFIMDQWFHTVRYNNKQLCGCDVLPEELVGAVRQEIADLSLYKVFESFFFVFCQMSVSDIVGGISPWRQSRKLGSQNWWVSRSLIATVNQCETVVTAIVQWGRKSSNTEEEWGYCDLLQKWWELKIHDY